MPCAVKETILCCLSQNIYIYIYIYIVFEQNYLQHKVRPNKLKGDSAGFLDRFMSKMMSKPLPRASPLYN